MRFLVISQRAKPDPNYSLKDLTGHGRFDVIPRVILAASRNIVEKTADDIFIYLKGSTDTGWIKWSNGMDIIKNIISCKDDDDKGRFVVMDLVDNFEYTKQQFLNRKRNYQEYKDIQINNLNAKK